MNKSFAYTLAESLIVIAIVGIMYVIVLHVLRPNNIKHEALTKAGSNLYIQIDFATKQMLAKNTKNYILTRLKDSSGEFSVESSSSASRLLAIYKKRLSGIRKTPDATYLNLALQDSSNNKVGNLKVSSFQGFTLKNDAYFGIKLNNNCTTTESYIYNPSMPNKRTQAKSCGLIFFDVNGQDLPNNLGVDQYIISIGKNGIR